jgi:hypothetical protein
MSNKGAKIKLVDFIAILDLRRVFERAKCLIRRANFPKRSGGKIELFFYI